MDGRQTFNNFDSNGIGLDGFACASHEKEEPDDRQALLFYFIKEFGQYKYILIFFFLL